MAEHVKPALTPDQWAALKYEDPPDEYSDGSPTYSVWARDPFAGERFGSCTDAPESQARPSPKGRHATAALALHGQPFGFTDGDTFAIGYARRVIHDRISALRASGTAGDMELAAAMGEVYEDLGNLIARIAALLPPE